MSGHVALVCLCVLFVWSVSSTVLREDGDLPSAETEEQAWTRIVEKHSHALLDVGKEGLEEKIRLTEQLTVCTARRLVLQARLEEREKGAVETRRVYAEQLASVNSRLDEAHKQISTALIYKNEAESLRAEVVMLKQKLEESAQNRDKLNDKLVNQISDLQEMFLQFIDSTKSTLKETSTKLGQDLIEINSKITNMALKSTSESNSIIYGMNNVKQEVINVKQEVSKASKKSDDILKEISSGKSKIQEGFARTSNERDSKYSALQSKNGDMMRAISSIKTTVDDSFVQMTNDRNSKHRELQSKHVEMLKVIESTKEQASIAASAATVASGMVVLGDRYYFFGKESKMSWHAARDFCVSKGLSLASIESAGENQRVYDHMKKIGLEFPWLGGNDENREGTWRWTGTGATLTYTNWGSGEPEGGTGENCFYMYRDGKWYDIACSLTRFPLCEQHN